jgi:stress-induced morphogen
MAPDAIIAKLRLSIPDADVSLKDLTGTADHWEAVIVSAAFAGKSLMQRHRMVNAALADELKGPIHALTMDLRAPGEPVP